MANTLPAFLAALDGLKRRIEDGSADGLKSWVDEVLVAANADGSVPVDTGALRASGYTEGPLTGSGRSTVRIGYGDTDVDYALLVHEQPQSARRTGVAKWCEIAIVQHADDLGTHLKAKVGA